MSYFFNVVNKNENGMVFITTEYLCEDTTKSNLLMLALPSFYGIHYFYKKYYNKFSLYVSNNEFLYELTDEDYKIGSNMNNIISGKYFLIIYANKN